MIRDPLWMYEIPYQAPGIAAYDTSQRALITPNRPDVHPAEKIPEYQGVAVYW